MVLDFTYKHNPCENKQKPSSSKTSTNTGDDIQAISVSKPVFVTVNKTKNKQADLKTVKKTSKFKQLSEKMKKIDFNNLPGEFGIVMAKQKKRTEKPPTDVIEIIDSDDENSRITSKTEVDKKSSDQSKPTEEKLSLKVPFLPQVPFLNPTDSKKPTNSKPVNSKSDKKLNLKNLEDKLKPGDKRPAYVDGMNVLYYHPDQNNPKKPKRKQGLNFKNLINVVQALQKLGYDQALIVGRHFLIRGVGGFWGVNFMGGFPPLFGGFGG